MSIIYKSKRVGKNGKVFLLYKFRTLKEGSDSKMFAGKDAYTRFGWIMRKVKFDELPQIFNILKGEMGIVGVRPEEERTIQILPKETRDILLSVKPGLTSLASIYFIDEEKLVQESSDPTRFYWTTIKPMKILLDTFYTNNKSLSLDAWIVWATIKNIIKSLWR